MLEYILKKSLPIFLVLCLCILSLTGCSGNDFDDVRQTTMFPGKVVSFKSDGIEYKFSFITEGGEVKSISEMNMNSTVKINEKMENGNINLTYGLVQRCTIEKDSTGKIISTTVLETSKDIDSSSPIILEMNTYTFKHGL